MKLDMPQEISRTCIKWQSEAPFFAEFLLRTKYYSEPEVGTIGVGIKNNRVCMWYSKEFLKNISEIEVEGVLMHEILHLLHKFNERLGGRDKNIFNIAQDACINEIVEGTHIAERRLKIPQGGVKMSYIEDMGYNGKYISEKVYDFLYENADKYTIGSGSGSGEDLDGDQDCQECNGTGKDDNGDQCKKCNGTSKEQGKKLSTTDNHSTQNDLGELEKQAIEEIVKNAKVKSWGSASGSAVSTIKELLKTKKIPWREKLNRLLAKYVSEPGGVYENTWSKRNRRGLPLPGIRKKSKQIVLTIDTSGSVGDDDIQKFFGQIEKIIKDYSQIHLIQWDTEVKSVSKYKKGDWKRIKVSGRGGTSFQPVLDYVHNNLKSTSALVNFTDGYFSWGLDTHGLDTIWAFINNDSNAPIGKTVHIIDEE